ncbi:MAG: 3-hydroxyacyl-ACP dehydratase FabZ [Comamonadaceae bacterium]|nr:MAG: 3-hydroxyacyl-ACP dehydratase FabZ [Comamonadaceae bacterium]
MELDIAGILERLPHRYPMLLIDRVIEMEPGKRIVAIKNVSINEPYFQGHFPGNPVMPGVLITEAMAQAAALFSFEGGGNGQDGAGLKTVYYLVGIDNARFRRPVVPGDQLRIEVEAKRLSRSMCKYRGQAFVDGAVVAEADLMCAIRTVSV